jgi:hypothetical protein
VIHCNVGHKKFWKLSWYELSLYIERFEVKENKRLDSWRQWRIIVSDFRNAHRGKKSRAIYPKDLITLPEDNRMPAYHEIDIEAVKRKFGSKLKKRGK